MSYVFNFSYRFLSDFDGVFLFPRTIELPSNVNEGLFIGSDVNSSSWLLRSALVSRVDFT